MSTSSAHAGDFRFVRTIHVRHLHTGDVSSGQLTVGPVEWLEDRKTWGCYFSIHVIHPEGHRIYGADAIEAVDRTLWFLGNLIRGSIEDGFGIWWHHEGDAAGFDAR
jgi:hypothetical protein